MENVQQVVAEDAALIEKLKHGYQEILRELRKVIIAQNSVVEQVMICMMVGAHSMITGVPGLAKTLLIKTLASVLDLKFKRIQFTPDLMPADITGTDIIQEDVTTGRRELVFVKDRKSTRLNSSHITISYAVFCLKKKTTNTITSYRDI